MDLIKRIFLSIKRNLSKSVMIGLVVFLLGNLVVASFYINKVTNYIENSITSELGALVSVHTKNNQNYFEYISLFNEDFVNTLITEKDENVDEIDIAVELYYLYSDNILSNSTKVKINNNNDFDLYEAFYTVGVNQPNFVDLKYGNITITKGRTFTDEEIENGEKVILLGEEYVHALDTCNIVEEEDTHSKSFKCYRTKEEINVNDHVELSRKITNKITNEVIIENEVYKVIGFFKTNNYTFENDFLNYEKKYTTPTYNIVMPINTVINEYDQYLNMRFNYIDEYNINEEDADDYISKPLLYINSVLYKYNNPSNVDRFSNVLENNLNSSYNNLLEVRTSKDDYEKVAAPLSGLNELSDMTLLGSIIISILVLTLVIILFFKGRNKEIGIYVALGEKKNKIILQFMFEIYLIGMVSVGCSVITGSVIGKYICSNVLETQIEKQQEIIENNDKLYIEYDFENYEDFDEIGLNRDNVIFIFTIESIVLIISSSYTIYYLLKFNPKDILM